MSERRAPTHLLPNAYECSWPSLTSPSNWEVAPFSHKLVKAPPFEGCFRGQLEKHTCLVSSPFWTHPIHWREGRHWGWTLEADPASSTNNDDLVTKRIAELFLCCSLQLLSGAKQAFCISHVRMQSTCARENWTYHLWKAVLHQRDLCQACVTCPDFF